MIPAKLTVRNFMSYGGEPTTLDFSGMHVVCLSGDNGNGKSALLDAMTYALWGRTRASGSQASGDDDLVRLGSEEMEVVFDFRLGDDLYRSIRKRSRRTRSGEWQLQLSCGGGDWQPVGGASMRERERYLARLLRMEYETFLNSAYIQQGRADEFTRQKPDARKRILADILDLTRYDRLEEMAKDRRDLCALAAKDLEGEIRHLESRAAEADSHRQALAGHEESLAKWTSERTDREEKLNRLRAQLAGLDEKAARLREREEHLREAEQEAAELASEIARMAARIEQNAALVARREEIESDYDRLQQARALVEGLERDVAALQNARQQQTMLKGRLEVRRQELLQAVQQAESEWHAVEERRRKIRDFDARLTDLKPKLAQLEGAESELTGVRGSLEQAQHAFADLGARNKQLRQEIEELDDVLEVLSQPKTKCPVCESDLSGGRQGSVLARQQGKRRNLESLLGEVKREGAARKKERDELQARADALQAQLRGAAALRAQGVEWQRSRDEAIAQNERAEEVEARLADLRRRMESGDYGAEERAAAAQVGLEIARLESTAREHESARAIVRELTARGTEGLRAQLQEAERSNVQLGDEKVSKEKRRDRRCSQIAVELALLESLRKELADHDSVRLSALDAQRNLQEAAESCDLARSQAERSRQALEDCSAAREQAALKSSERDKILKDRQAFSELAAAFGKKGVQALIIDNALPEVQEEANRLLSRMTDNAMKVSLTTLREKRSSSGQIETLDISITDDAGTRPYEMFSGGEAFRVNFAIRIALSRLLARRAGARLQTLILDEGFGTQDAKGRERLVEAIQSVQDEFALILVISHIEELKDAFPTRIEIVKTSEGSRIEYLE